MKKALILALLGVSAAFAPRVRKAAESPGHATAITTVASSPLFWRLSNELLSRELIQWTSTAPEAAEQLHWRPELRDTLVCILSHVVLQRAFHGFVSATK